MRDVLARAADQVGAPSMTIASGAGHDARYLHYFCPTGMIFVPCRAGISHNEAEYTSPEELAAGCEVMLGATLKLASAS